MMNVGSRKVSSLIVPLTMMVFMTHSVAIERIVLHSVLSWSTTYSQIATMPRSATSWMKAQAPPSVAMPLADQPRPGPCRCAPRASATGSPSVRPSTSRTSPRIEPSEKSVGSVMPSCAEAAEQPRDEALQQVVEDVVEEALEARP